ncbi:MAG: hypothetical protein MUE73_19610, partial [Planctomycetes bacterium]|nr:hypothetical protein [Planctomycetota bacterium]
MHKTPAGLAAAVLVLLVIPVPARAAGRGALLHAGDALTSAIAAESDRDEFTVELSEGAVLSVAVAAAKGGGLLLDLELQRPDRVVVDPGALLAGRGTGKLALKGYVVPAGQTGLWTLVVKPQDGTSGGYTISAKMKAPKPPSVKALALGGDGKALVEFTGENGALASVKIKVAAGGPLAKAQLLDPAGAAIAGTDFTASLALASFTLRSGFGRYAVELTGPAGATVDVSVKLKVPKPVKRKLALPPEGSLAAASLLVKQEDAGHDFVLAGANLRAGSALLVSGTGVAVASVAVSGATSLEVSFDVDSAAPYGTRDLTLVPPPLDGEPFLLPASLTVQAPDPTITSVTVGGDGVLRHGAAREITVTGTGFRSGGTYGFTGSGL